MRSAFSWWAVAMTMAVGVALAWTAVAVRGEVVLSDNWGNSASLPLAHPGEVTNQFSMGVTQTNISPYVVSIFVNEGGHEPEKESFYFVTQNLGQVTLHSSTWSPTFALNDAQAGDYWGSADQPVSATGMYTFTFDVPQGAQMALDVVYLETSDPEHIMTQKIHLDAMNQPVPI